MVGFLFLREGNFRKFVLLYTAFLGVFFIVFSTVGKSAGILFCLISIAAFLILDARMSRKNSAENHEANRQAFQRNEQLRSTTPNSSPKNSSPSPLKDPAIIIEKSPSPNPETRRPLKSGKKEMADTQEFRTGNTFHKI